MTIETLRGANPQRPPKFANPLVGTPPNWVILVNGFDRRELVIVSRDGVGPAVRPAGSAKVHRVRRGHRTRGGWPGRAWAIPRVSAWRLARRPR